MSSNVSSSSNDLLPSYFSSFINFGLCFISPPSSSIFASFFVTCIFLLLPLCVFILYLGFQRWRQQSSASTAAMTSHSDIFTYHLVAMEIIGIFGYILCFCGIYGDHFNVLLGGIFSSSITWFGETSFHVLTCVERYLAVVRPVTYLSLRGERAIRARNVSIGCVWLFSLGGPCLMTFKTFAQILGLGVLVSSLVITSFCSLSTLCALIRPGPGEGGGDRKRVDQSKLRAFYTIVAILCVLLLRFVVDLHWIFFYKSAGSHECLMLVFGVWLNLPSSLVLPLLYLHRAGRLACCKSCNK